MEKKRENYWDIWSKKSKKWGKKRWRGMGSEYEGYRV